MTRYAIDAPTLVHLVDARVPVHPGHQLVAPNAIRSDALEILYADVRSGRRRDADALVTHDLMTGLKMRLLGDRVSRRVAWKIAVEQHWESFGEAEYLAVASLQADAFVTVDEDMAATAQKLVRLASVEELQRC